MNAIKNIIKAALEEYTGRSFADVLIEKDPKVAHVYAVRTVADGPFDFIVRTTRTMGIIRVEQDDIIETCFTSWPPKSGELKFMV